MSAPTPTAQDDGTLVCSEGCPVVIWPEDWDHHLEWHQSLTYDAPTLVETHALANDLRAQGGTVRSITLGEDCWVIQLWYPIATAPITSTTKEH